MSENPNYYAIIPSFVRYCKELKANEKLLYGEITCLSNKSWECFASNAYFAELYWVSERQITERIKCLFKHGFIYVRIEKQEWNKRYISITPNKEKSTDLTKKNSTGYRRKVLKGIEEKFQTPIEENFQYNNTSNNTIKNNNINIISPNGEIAYGNQEINQIFEIVKKYNNWISDDLWKWRIFWSHLLKKLKKIDKVENWQFLRNDYLVWILEIISKNSYHQHKIASVQKIYYNLAELIQIANADYLKTKKNVIEEF